MSKFGEWFKAQFGGLPPGQEEYEEARLRVHSVRQALRQAEQDLDNYDLLQSQWDAALYAWQAREMNLGGLWEKHTKL